MSEYQAAVILVIVFWIGFRFMKAFFSDSQPKNIEPKPKVQTTYERKFQERKRIYESRVGVGKLKNSPRKKTMFEKQMEERQKEYKKRDTAKQEKKWQELEKKRKATARKKRKIKLKEKEAQGGSGSGFLINNSGHVVTNYHVIGSSKKVKIRTHEKNYIGKVIAIDRINDLALIKIATQKNSHLKLASNDSDRLDSIITAGFPYGDSFSSHVKSTTGIVSALVGPGNNTSQLQISASIQPGNSGGPIIDGNNGSVVGVAVAKLDTEKFIEMYRSIPENVNFAIKSSTLKRFLKSNKIEFSSSDDSKLTNKEINSLIDSAVLFISC